MKENNRHIDYLVEDFPFRLAILHIFCHKLEFPAFPNVEDNLMQFPVCRLVHRYLLETSKERLILRDRANTLVSPTKKCWLIDCLM